MKLAVGSFKWWEKAKGEIGRKKTTFSQNKLLFNSNFIPFSLLRSSHLHSVPVPIPFHQSVPSNPAIPSLPFNPARHEQSGFPVTKCLSFSPGVHMVSHSDPSFIAKESTPVTLCNYHGASSALLHQGIHALSAPP